jgi:hypothetical protein
MFGGRGTALAALEVATKSSTRASCSIGLNRRSNPTVVDAFELIAAPQSDPATWPG